MTTLVGLNIDTSQLDAVSTATAVRRTQVSTGRRGSSASVVAADVLAQVRTDECRCEDEQHMGKLGLPTLHAGTPIRGEGGLQGISPQFNPETQRWVRVGGEHAEGLGSGCTTGRHVCNRLDKVRRRYGL